MLQPSSWHDGQVPVRLQVTSDMDSVNHKVSGLGISGSMGEACAELIWWETGRVMLVCDDFSIFERLITVMFYFFPGRLSFRWSGAPDDEVARLVPFFSRASEGSGEANEMSRMALDKHASNFCASIVAVHCRSVYAANSRE